MLFINITKHEHFCCLDLRLTFQRSHNLFHNLLWFHRSSTNQKEKSNRCHLRYTRSIRWFDRLKVTFDDILCFCFWRIVHKKRTNSGRNASGNRTKANVREGHGHYHSKFNLFHILLLYSTHTHTQNCIKPQVRDQKSINWWESNDHTQNDQINTERTKFECFGLQIQHLADSIFWLFK